MAKTTQKVPPGTILDDAHAPVLVMEDELGIFVLCGRYRHYHLDMSTARQTAAALAQGHAGKNPPAHHLI